MRTENLSLTVQMYPADDVHVRLATLTRQLREITGRMREQVRKSQGALDARTPAQTGEDPRVCSRFRRMSSSSSSSADSGEIMG